MSHEKTVAEATPAAAAPTDMDMRLADLRERKAKRDEAQEQEAKRLELEELELEEKYEGELGKRGVDFEVVRTPVDGCIVVKRGPSVLYKAFQRAMAKTDGDPTPESVHAYVVPCVVHPTKEAFNKIADLRPIVALRCANALSELHGGRKKDEQGKY